jgi:hypothetical protein
MSDLEEFPRRCELVTLRDYFELNFSALQRDVDTNLKWIDNSTRTAMEQLNKRLEGMNEFRAVLSDQATKFMTRTEYSSAHKALEQEIQSLREFRAKLDGLAKQSHVTIAFVIASIGAISGVASMIVEFIRLAK